MADRRTRRPAADARTEVSNREVVAALSTPATYGGDVRSVEVHETHISWVFLAGERAFKLKKPLVLPFLDYGSADRRHQMCREEVRLNRRLAPELYLGVRSVIETAAGVRLGADEDPAALDYVVELRRYDEERTLARTFDRGELARQEVAVLGGVLARFHERAEPVEPAVRTRGIERQMMKDFQELLELVEPRGEIRRLLALERFAHAFLSAHEQLVDGRARAGLVREGHGDLRAEHVLLGRPVQIVDCIEFDWALRELDVADDLAFLVMDLDARGARRFSRALVDGYRQAGGDPGPDALIAFYACHRALVRAKVALLRAQQLRESSHEHGRESAAARDLLAVAERFAWRARMPLVIVVCGVPATGKSRLARSLAKLAGVPHLSSDVTRKRLAGVDSRERAPGDVYAAEFTRRTYTELGRRAGATVATRGAVVVDATFRHRADREAFRDGFGDSARLLFVECVAPLRVLTQRAARRDRRRSSVSDASLEVVTRESTVWDPLDEVRPEAHLVLRSDRPVEMQVSEIIDGLDARLGWLSLPSG